MSRNRFQERREAELAMTDLERIIAEMQEAVMVPDDWNFYADVPGNQVANWRDRLAALAGEGAIIADPKRDTK